MSLVTRAAVDVAATMLVVAATLVTAPATTVAQPSGGAATGMAVTVAKATHGCFIDQIQVSGTLVPREEFLVRPETEGLLVSRIMVEDGDRVTLGQVLAHLARPGADGPLATAATVRAPAAGVVNYRFIQIGMMASSRAEPLFRIIGNGDIELQGDVPATRIAKLVAGQTARVEIAGVGDTAGRVRVIAAEIDVKTQLGKARISVENDERVKVGAYARAVVTVGRSCNPAVPLSAVFYGPEGAVVQVVRNNRVEMRRVGVGLLSGGDAEIREGLTEGDLVVSRAGAFLREGDRVRSIVGGGASGGETR
jgi:HlyD family secretion protein